MGDRSVRFPLTTRNGEARAWIQIDESDHAEVAANRWHLLSGRYAARNMPRPGYGSIYLHRQLMGLGPADKLTVDHINGDTLDNRRSNLRVVTHGVNMQNQTSRGGTSPYFGVSWHRGRNVWRGAVNVNGTQRHVGYFTTEDEAARAVLAFVREHRPDALRAIEQLEGAWRDVG